MNTIPGDVLTEEIVKRLRQMNKKTISYSDIYDLIITVCFDKEFSIADSIGEETFKYIESIKGLKNHFQIDFIQQLRDEIMMHFYYVKNSHSLTESQNAGKNIHSERNAVLKLFSEEFYSFRIPNIIYIKVLRSNADKNPYYFKKREIDCKEFFRFTSDLSAQLLMTPSQRLLTFASDNGKEEKYNYLLDYYYLEKSFKMSYIKRFFSEFQIYLDRYIKLRFEEYIPFARLIKKLQDFIDKNTTTQVSFQKTYTGKNFDATNVIKDAYITLNELKQQLSECTLFLQGLGININQIMNSSPALQLSMPLTGIVNSALECLGGILALIVENNNPNPDRTELLLKISYDFSGMKIDTTNPYILDGGQIVGIAERLQGYGKKRAFSEKEKASGLYRLISVYQKLTQKLEDNKYNTNSPKNRLSLNFQNRFCSIICDTINFCFALTKVNIIEMFSCEDFADGIVNKNDIKFIFTTLCDEYNTTTNTGNSLICRSYLYADETNCNIQSRCFPIFKNQAAELIQIARGYDDNTYVKNNIFPRLFYLNQNRSDYLESFQMLHYNISKYLFAQIVAVKNKLEEPQSESGIAVEYDNKYKFSHIFIDQLKKISQDIESYQKEIFTLSSFNFAEYEGVEFTLTSEINERLYNLQIDYYNMFLMQIFKQIRPRQEFYNILAE